MSVLESQICKSDFAEGGLFWPLVYWNVSKVKEQWCSNSTDKGKQRRSSSLQFTRDLHYRDTFHRFMFIVFQWKIGQAAERQHPAWSSDRVINLALLHAAPLGLGGSIEHLANQRERKADRPSARPRKEGIINVVFQFVDKNIWCFLLGLHD